MNKKFSTLMAGLLLAGSFPVAAQFCPTPNGEVDYRTRMVKSASLDGFFRDVKKINPKYQYQLMVDPVSMGLEVTTGDPLKEINYYDPQCPYVLTVERDYSTGKLYLTAQKAIDATLTHSLWEIKVNNREGNGRLFTYENKETGFELTFDHVNALRRVGGALEIPADYVADDDRNSNVDWTYEDNGLLEGCNFNWAWYTTDDNGSTAFDFKQIYSYFHNTDSVMYLKAVKKTDANLQNAVYPAGGFQNGLSEKGLTGNTLVNNNFAEGFAVIPVKESKATAEHYLNTVSAEVLRVKPVVAGAKVLNADEINTMIDADGSFLSFGKNGSVDIAGYNEWKDAENADRKGKSTKFTVLYPGTDQEMTFSDNPFKYDFVAIESEIENLGRNSDEAYAGYNILLQAKDPIETAGSAKKYGYLYVDEDTYEGNVYQGQYNGLKVVVAPYAYLDGGDKKVVLKYDEASGHYANNAGYPDALQARYHWKVTYYATNDSVVFEPLNASRKSQAEATDKTPFEDTHLAGARIAQYLNTVNKGLAYPISGTISVPHNTMANKAAGVPVALYAMNFGPEEADKMNLLTVGYASGKTITSSTAIEAGNANFAAVRKAKINWSNYDQSPAYVTNNTGYEYQSAMELLLRFNREYPYLQRATKETGLYFINLTNIDPSNAVTENYENGSYVVMDMGGHVVYDVAQKEQNFSHMPATQWVVEQQPCDVTAAEGNVNYNKYPTVRIYNREFAGKEVFDGQLYVDEKGGLFTINHRDYGKDAKQYNVDKHGYMKRTLNCNDFYVFNPVQDINTLGYFNENNEVLRNSTYQFQHMFDMGVDKFLGIDNLKADMDTLRLVTDGVDVATQFELFRSEGWYPTPDSAWVFNDVTLKKEYQPTGTYSFSYRDSLEYGYTSEAANAPQLYKTFYKIKVKDNNLIDNDHKFVAIKNQHKYVVVDEATINSDPTLEFAIVSLKENNCLDGTHGYALVNTPKIILAEKVAGSELKNLRKATEDASGADLEDDFGNKYTVYYVDSNDSKKFEADKDKVMVTIYEDGMLNKKQLTGKLAIEEISLDAKIAALCETTTSVFKLVNADRPLYRDLSAEYADLINNEKKVINIIGVDEQSNEFLFEDSNSKPGMNYLGIENKTDLTSNEGFYVDKVAKSTKVMPQYLFAVAADSVPAYTYCNCDIDGHLQHGINAGCGHAETYPGYVEGRFLINFNDSINKALIDKETNADKYKSSVYTRLGFVEAIHRGDYLYVLTNGRTLASLKMEAKDGSGMKYICPDSLAKDQEGKIYTLVELNGMHNNAAFSLRNTGDADNTFMLESNDTPTGVKGYSKVGSFAGAWVKVINGVPVLAKYWNDNGNHNTGDTTDSWFEMGDYTDASDVTGEFINQGARFTFEGIDKDSQATANETIATSSVIVAGTNGAVVVKGAEGKSVIVSTILGKVVANEVLTSDNAQIAAPQGVVVVSVDGESFKVVVK